MPQWYDIPDYGAPRMAPGSGSLAQPLSSLRAAPTSFPTANPSVGGSMDPLTIAMAAGGALQSLGGLLDPTKKRQLELQRQQQYQNQYMTFANAINDQRQRAARTPGMEALMTQMAQRLGVNLPMQRAKELEIRPVSGNDNIDKTFADQYGGPYADRYNASQPTTIKPRFSPTMSLMQNMLGARRNG